MATDMELVVADSTPGLLGAIERSDGNPKTASIVVVVANKHAICNIRVNDLVAISCSENPLRVISDLQDL